MTEVHTISVVVDGTISNVKLSMVHAMFARSRRFMELFEGPGCIDGTTPMKRRNEIIDGLRRTTFSQDVFITPEAHDLLYRHDGKRIDVAVADELELRGLTETPY